MNKLIFALLLVVSISAYSISPLVDLHKILEGFAAALNFQTQVPSGKLCVQQTSKDQKLILKDLTTIISLKYPDSQNALEDIFDRLNNITQICGDDMIQSQQWLNEIRKNFKIKGYKQRINEHYNQIVLNSAAALICYHHNDYYCYGKQLGTVFGLIFEVNYQIASD